LGVHSKGVALISVQKIYKEKGKTYACLGTFLSFGIFNIREVSKKTETQNVISILQILHISLKEGV